MRSLLTVFALTLSTFIQVGNPLSAAVEEVITFPDDAGVIDVTKAPYNAKPDGVTDCSDAIQKALDDHGANNRIIYLPNGTYLVTSTIEWPPSRRLKDTEHKYKGDWGDAWKMTILQGQSRSKTIIKLKDACPGFQETGIADKRSSTGKRSSIAKRWQSIGCSRSTCSGSRSSHRRIVCGS